MTVLKYILLSLAIAVCLFYGLMKRFGWAHYHRWTFFITKTEAKLSGQWLDRYLHSHALLAFYTAGWLFLFFFESMAPYRAWGFFFFPYLAIRSHFHFKRIAADEFRDREV